MDAEATLKKAADLLREFGWTKRTRLNRTTGAMCVMGALGKAAHGNTHAGPYGGDPAFELLKKRVAQLGWDDCAVWQWNDAPQRTMNEVIAVLEGTHAGLLA